MGVSARSAVLRMAESVVVTDGTGSFSGSRMVFQFLHDYGDYEKIVAFAPSTSDSKKMLISRQARYSGLIDVLEFEEGGAAELAAVFGSASTWLVLNADPETIGEQLKAAAASGVKRAFIHTTEPVDDAAVAASGDAVACTVMRTGTLAKSGTGTGLLLGEMDTAVCDDVPQDDVFRFITEALTIPEANGRLFSLCPSADTTQLKAMRMAGCTRREEVEALLKGQIKEVRHAPHVQAPELGTPSLAIPAAPSRLPHARAPCRALNALTLGCGSAPVNLRPRV